MRLFQLRAALDMLCQKAFTSEINICKNKASIFQADGSRKLVKFICTLKALLWLVVNFQDAEAEASGVCFLFNPLYVAKLVNLTNIL